MSRVELLGRRFVTARIAQVTGAVSWWVFVVARLMTEMNSAALNSGLPRRYADYDGSIFGVGLGHKDFGWTAYEPLTNHPPSPLNDVFFVANVIASVAVVALVITAIAAVVEAVSVARWPAGIATILAPITGAAVILTALHYGTGFGSGLQLNLLIVFALVLLGVAIREVWSRVWAPRPTRAE
ncbi:hypothetical protein [Mycolicibacterium sp. lyk4-40-TYG-92]|uniref:hypothetical protein n=1 Tax=Mycolicibacterium sp. lyk4-40-TYG-92 TaxID=3040295 RepID=UPI00254B7036|nr:hypothetical protein [Mycolicibacterium sp. lyk4-40-TYG-92]